MRSFDSCDGRLIELKTNVKKPLEVVGIVKVLFLSGFLSVFLSSCASVGPDFKGIDPPKQAEWMEYEEGRVVTDGGEIGRWWESFNDPVLNNLVEMAYEQNLSLQVAGLRVLEVRARLGRAIGAQFPELSVGGSYQVQKNSDRDINGSSVGSATDHYSNIGFDASWELDLWGRYRRGVEAETASLVSAYANYDDVLVSLTAEVASAYINLRAFEKRIEIAKKNAALQQRSLDITSVRFRNDMTTELDVRRAETLVMQTKSLIPVLEKGYSIYEHGLAVLLGIPPFEIEKVLEEGRGIPSVPKQIIAGVPTDLVRRRPDIRRAELDAAAESARIGVAKADLYPSFFVSGSFGRLDNDVTYDAHNEFTYAMISPGFNWSIFNFGQIKNNVRAQDARFQQAISNYENTVLNAYREVEDSMVSFLRTGEQVGFLSKSVKAAERSVELALIQYRDGAIDYTPVIDTQSILTDEQDQLIVSEGEVALNLIGVYKALGGGWEARVGDNIVPEDVKGEMEERTDWGDLLKGNEVQAEKALPESPIPFYTDGN